MPRKDGRRPHQLRPVKFTLGYLKHPEGSVLVEIGETKVICTASIEEKVPFFMRGTGQGWVTAEYGMLPRSTASRTPREVSRGRPGGRTQEIQRLIGRSLRAVVDLARLGERTVWIDCDVIQADGGTRTASITGSFLALVLALESVRSSAGWEMLPVLDFLAAVSVGIVDGEPVLDLCYEEDARAQVDMNLAMTASGKIVEIQGTAEESPFRRDQLDDLLGLAEDGIRQLIEMQRTVLPPAVAARVRQGDTHVRPRPRFDE